MSFSVFLYQNPHFVSSKHRKNLAAFFIQLNSSAQLQVRNKECCVNLRFTQLEKTSAALGLKPEDVIQKTFT